MPFKEGGSVESDLVGGRVGSGLPAARLIVDPEQVHALRDGIEQERVEVEKWLVANIRKLNYVPRPGTDPCSKESAEALSENGQAAVEAAQGYVQELRRVVQALGEIAHEYRLMDDESAGRLGGGTK